uniref:Protein kinase domain-containing protein n=1 Tax=Haptolina ericina TaxID=156174 RepID=A0A7S3C4T5_9EUKA
MHRNIRPRSIYLTHSMNARIGDLVVAKVARPGEENTPETGAYRYMAPEVILHQPYSTKCDVYSFAMTWYELLHLRPPLAELKAAQAAFHAVYNATRPEIHLSPSFSIFGNLLVACWDADPDKRPAPSEIAEMVVSGLLMDQNELVYGFDQMLVPGSK